MNKFEVAVILGRLEIRFREQELILEEVKMLKKFIAEDEFFLFAINFGKFDEMIKSLSIDVSDCTKPLLEFISQIDKDAETLAKEKKEQILDLKLADLDFSIRTFNCLSRAGKRTVRDLTGMTEDDLMRVRNLGKTSVNEVIEKLKELGLKSSEE